MSQVRPLPAPENFFFRSRAELNYSGPQPRPIKRKEVTMYGLRAVRRSVTALVSFPSTQMRRSSASHGVPEQALNSVVKVRRCAAPCGGSPNVFPRGRGLHRVSSPLTDLPLCPTRKIYATSSPPNFFLPWTRKPQRDSTGSGFVIEGGAADGHSLFCFIYSRTAHVGPGSQLPPTVPLWTVVPGVADLVCARGYLAAAGDRRILTNAHCVADQTLVMVRSVHCVAWVDPRDDVCLSM